MILKHNLNIGEIAAGLSKDRVILSGLGIFRARMSKPTTARNPKTGEMVQVPSKVKIRFKPAKSLLDSLAGKLK